MQPDVSPPALAAVAVFPHLYAQVEQSLARQARRIAERTAHFVPRPALIKTLDDRIRGVSGGAVALEGPPGCGTTTLLCYLAATRPYAFWLPEDDAGAGVEALCAQLLALYGLPVPLVPPAAGRDATTLERLLAEAAAQRPPGDPLVVLIDRLPDERATALLPPLPALVPPGAVVVLACAPKASPPLQITTRVTVPVRGVQLERRLAEAAIQLGGASGRAAYVAAHSRGLFLYTRLAVGLLELGLLHSNALPAGLEELHQRWWNQLDPLGRRIAGLLAGAGAPLGLNLLAALAAAPDDQVRNWIDQHQPFLEIADGQIQLYHTITRGFITEQSGDDLASAHARYVELAHMRSGGRFEQLSPASDGYLVRQLARHITFSHPRTRADAATALGSRAWIVTRERYTGTMRAAAADLAWELRMAARDGPALRLVRAAATAGTLALLARGLPPDALAEAFAGAIEQGGAREATLKRVRDMLDQLPDGRDKALALRRLGEVCYALRMRAPAMRMLSEALDLEVQGLPRAWRDEREETLVAFARAAIAAGVPDTALGITARILHAERRGMIETEVVRWLLARDQRTRAEEVAYAIGHQPMHEWAMAEVAVGHARGGDWGRAEVVLSTLKTETAIAWARGELACDAARQGDPHAADDIMQLANPSLRDRALALVAQAFAAGGYPDLALDAARRAEDREVRARAFLDLVLLHPPNASTALAHAAADIVALTDDERAPLVASLAAAQAAMGRLETGLHTAALLPEGEERDRAQSRIAVALARHGDEANAQTIAAAIGDDDERSWALDELARLLAERGEWHAAFALAEQISDLEQRVRTEADLCIAWARFGAPVAAQARAEQLALPAEQARAYSAIVGPLVEQDAKTQALATLAGLKDPGPRSRYQAALAAALAAHDELVAAQAVARTIPRPYERARALVAIARVMAPDNKEQAHQALGEALRAAASLGRTETFVCLEWAAETLATLGGVELLLAAASALDEVDTWWS